MDGLHLDWEPQLRSPWLVLGFEGWPNAADTSSGSVRFLREKLGGLKFGEFDAQLFQQFSSHRPVVSVQDGLVKGLAFPSSRLYAWSDPKGSRDLIFLQGVEPDLRWRDFIALLLDLAQRLGVVRTLSVGGVLSATPHTREPRVSCAYSHARLRSELEPLSVDFTAYEGPSSIHSSFLVAAQERDLEGLSFWGSAPHYVQGPNPMVWHAVLRRLGVLLGVELPLGELRAAGEKLRRQLDQNMSADAEVRAYVHKLEELYDASADAPPAPPSDDAPPPGSGEPLRGEEVLRGVEEFLKRRQDEGQNAPG